MEFEATISSMGKGNLIIWIPQAIHPMAERLKGKKVRVIIQ
jgi:hypothetical protein